MALKDWVREEDGGFGRIVYRSGSYELIIDGNNVIVGDTNFEDAFDEPEISESFKSKSEALKFAKSYMKEN